MGKGKGKTWTEKEENFLRDNYKNMTHREMSVLLETRTVEAVKNRCQILGYIIPKWRWTDEKVEILKAKYPDTRSDKLVNELGCNLYTLYKKAFSLGLKKSAEFLRSDECGRITSKNCHLGKYHRFAKGNRPWNKGKKGYMGANRTSFKKGQLPHNTAKVGDTAPIKGGYLKIKIANPNKWQLLTHYVWEQHHGSRVPKGFLIRFKDGNINNYDIENLEMISLKENAVRNSFHNIDYPDELKSAIKSLAKLNRTINRRMKNAKK